MINFAYATETDFVDYIEHAVTSSLLNYYPILLGHSPVTNSSDYPRITVTVDGYLPAMQFSGVQKASLMVDVTTVAYDENAYYLHSFAVSEVERTMGNLPAIINWINNPSASIWVAGMNYDSVACPIDHIEYNHSFRYTVTAQRLIPSSSYTWVYPFN